MSREVIDILEDLPPYQGDQRMITRRQDTFDIIREILRKHKGTMAHYDAICEQHWKGSPQATAQGLYNFLKSHAPYRVEPTLKQTVKTPAAILSERLTFGNDCKHYASYIVGVGEALRRRGYPVKSFYRFASYTRGSKNPGHVFGVFVIDGKEFWIDPVPEIPGFNARTPVPSYTTDRMPPMSKNGSRIGTLYDISGISNEDRISGRHEHWRDQMDRAHKPWLNPVNKNMLAEMRMQQRRDPLGRGLQPVQRYAPQQGHTHQHLHWLDQPKPHYYDLDVNGNLIGKAKKKHPIKIHAPKIHAPHIKIKAPHLKIKVPHIKIQPGKIALKVTLAPARGSFLLLTELNTFDLGVKMWEKAAKDQNGANWKKLANEWKKLGGKPAALVKSIKKGVNTHNKLHSKHKISGEIYDFYSGGMAEPSYGIGVVAAVPAAIAAAAPIIAALSSLLKSFGINTKKASADSADALNTVAKKHNKHGKNTDDDGDTTHDDGTVTAADQGADGGQSLTIKDVPGAKDADNGAGPDVPTPGPTAGGGDDSSSDDSASPATTDDSGDTTPAKAGGGGFAAMLESVKGFIGDHKVYFIGGAIVIAALIIFKIVHKPAKRGRR